MVINIKLFGIAAEQAGERTIQLDVTEQCDLYELQNKLKESFPKLESVVNFSIAINRSYTKENCVINQHDEIALIPPVSGG
jgi:molybdopterin synthase sulfur carrier subunit